MRFKGKQKMFRYCLSSFFAATMILGNVLGSVALAEEATLEQTLILADLEMLMSQTFFAIEPKKAPGHSTIINNDMLENSPSRTLGDLINNYVPGMQVNQHEFSGSILAVRGVSFDNNGKTLLLLDGQNMNMRSHFGSQAEWGVPLIGDMDRVEVVNGPGGIVHGSGAISGFVNMIPKNGTDNEGFSADVEYGIDDESYKTELGYGTSYGDGRDLYLYAGYVEAYGVYGTASWPGQDYTTGNANAVNTGGEDFRVHGFPRPTYKLAAYWNHDNFSLNTYFHDYNPHSNGPNTAAGGSNVGEEDMHTNSSKLAISPKYTLNLTDGLDLDFLGYFGMYQYYLDRGDLTDNGLREGAAEKFGELKMIAKSQQIDKHNIALGVSAERRKFYDQEAFFHGGVENWRGGVDMHWHTYSVFGEDVMELTDKLTLSLGGRYDYIRYSPMKSLNERDLNNVDNMSHRVAAAYEITENQTIKSSYQEGFRYPDPGYYYYVEYSNDVLENDGQGRPLPDLQPEEMTSTDIAYHIEMPSIDLEMDFIAYYNVYNSTIHWHNYYAAPYPLTQAQVDATTAWFGSQANSEGKFRSMGIEIVGDWDITDNYNIHASYGYSRPHQVDDSSYTSLGLTTTDRDEWKFFPKHMIKLVATGKFLDDKLTASLAWNFKNGISYSKIAGSGANWGYNGKVYSDHTSKFDVSASYKFNDSFSASILVKNVFDDHHPSMTNSGSPYGGAMGEERRYTYISAKYNF